MLGEHLGVLFLHLVEKLDVFVVIDAALGAEPFAHVEDTSRFDELFIARSLLALQLAGDDIVGLISLQAHSLAKFLYQKGRINIVFEPIQKANRYI